MLNLLHRATMLVTEVRAEKSAATIEDLLAWQSASLPKLTMARIRQIVEEKGHDVDDFEWTQLKYVLEERSAKKSWWRR